jgi:hypothetical protein
LNLDNLSNQGAGPQPGRTGGELATLQLSTRVLTAPAAWVNPTDGSTWVFVTTVSSTSAYQLTASGSNVALTSKWTNTSGGTSPLVANNVLYVAAPNVIRALSAATGTQLWSASIGGIHWESPVVANGVLYILDEAGNLTAFSAPPVAIPAMPRWTRGLAALGLLLIGLIAARGIAVASRRRRGAEP